MQKGVVRRLSYLKPRIVSTLCYLRAFLQLLDPSHGMGQQDGTSRKPPHEMGAAQLPSPHVQAPSLQQGLRETTALSMFATHMIEFRLQFYKTRGNTSDEEEASQKMKVFQQLWSVVLFKIKKSSYHTGDRFRKWIVVNYSLIIYQSGHKSLNSLCGKCATVYEIGQQRVNNLVTHMSRVSIPRIGEERLETLKECRMRYKQTCSYTFS